MGRQQAQVDDDQLWQEQAIILAKSWKLNSMPYLRLFSSRNSWNLSASSSVRASPKSVSIFLASFTDILQVFSPSPSEPVSLWMASKASMSSSSMFCSLGRFSRKEMMFAKPIDPSLLGSSAARISFSSASVGQCPSPRMKMGNCAVGIVPLSSLSKMEKSSWQQMSSYLDNDSKD